MVQAFAAHRANKPFADSVGARGRNRRVDHFDATASSSPLKLDTVFAVVITDEEAWARAKGRGFSDLLGHPGIIGSACDGAMDDTP